MPEVHANIGNKVMFFVNVNSRGQSLLISFCFQDLQYLQEAEGEAAADEKSFLMSIKRNCYKSEN